MFWIVSFIVVTCLVAVVWLFLRIYLPVRALEDLTRRATDGHVVDHLKVDGPGPIRRVARGVSQLSDYVASERSDRRQLEIYLAALQNNLEEGVALINHERVVQSANRAFIQMFRLRGEPVGQRLIDLLQIYELNDGVSSALDHGQASDEEVFFQLPNAPGPRPQSFRLLVQPLPPRQDGNRSCLLVTRDLSKLKEMESFERQVVAGVSHELRTPLSVFKGYLEALRDIEVEGRPETRRMLEILTRHSNRLNSLVEDLLVLSRLESGLMDLELESVHLRGFFDRLIEDAGKYLRPGLRLQCRIEEGLEQVVMDEFRMEQVFYNLIDNAQRYSDSNLPIEAGALRDEKAGGVHFYVKDQGRGIPSDRLDLIFNQFYRVDRARSREAGGTGLGLTIVREIARAHGGEAWAESSLGRGATLFVRIPSLNVSSNPTE